MELNEYQNFTDETALYSERIDKAMSVTDQEDWLRFLSLAYAAGKLNGEAGEIAEEVFKALRDDSAELSMERVDRIAKELGDVLYYVARIAHEIGFTLEEVAEQNMKKLRDRKERGVISGRGSGR
jgi:NTP pyrophosphatase (non-canonical NTP hydrolase)